MARKTHLQANKGESKAPFALCASRVNAHGRVEFNGRRSYLYMASEIVQGPAFVATPQADRCAHCFDVLLQRRASYPKLSAAVCEAV